MGRYSNPNITARIRQVLTGQGQDRMSDRPVRSLRQKQTRLTAAQRSELITRYQAGESANTLAKNFNVHRTTVTELLKRSGVSTRYNILSKRDIDTAVKLYQQGQSLSQVAEHFQVHANTVRKALIERGVKTRPVGTNQWS